MDDFGITIVASSGMPVEEANVNTFYDVQCLCFCVIGCICVFPKFYTFIIGRPNKPNF